MRKRVLLLSAVALVTVSPGAFAGSVAGNGGATEVTQIQNNIQLASSYAQQLQQYSTQLQQYQAQMRNLALNPTSMMGADVNKIINGVGGVMAAGNSIGGTMASIDQKFGQTFNSQTALNYSDRFKQLTSMSTDTLGAAMRAAGLHRDAYATDTAAVNALYVKSQNSQGQVAAIQTLSEICVALTQQVQGLKDLIGAQNVASSTWMLKQDGIGRKGNDDNDAIQAGFAASKTDIPRLDTSTRTYKKWDFYQPK